MFQRTLICAIGEAFFGARDGGGDNAAACPSGRAVAGAKSPSIERAVLLFVGVMILPTVLPAAVHSINWLWLTALLGVHLVQASFTGMCPVGALLKRRGLRSDPAFS